MKNLATIFTTILALGCFPLLIKAQAVPDAAERAPSAPQIALAGFNTADGDHALFNVTTGSANTAVGWSSLFSNTDGSYNTAGTSNTAAGAWCAC